MTAGIMAEFPPLVNFNEFLKTSTTSNYVADVALILASSFFYRDKKERFAPVCPTLPPVSAQNKLLHQKSKMVNPFGHADNELPSRIFKIGFYLILAFFIIWGASIYWSIGLPPLMRVFLPLAKASGRGMTWTLCILYITTFRSTQTAIRNLLQNHPDAIGFIAGAIPFHDIMPSAHAALGVVAFVLACTHTLFHLLDYILFWGTVYWPITWNFSVGFDGQRGTVWLLITGCVLFLTFLMTLFIPGVRHYYFPKSKAFAQSYAVFINLHWAGFLIFTIFISIHAQNQAYSDVTIMYWVLGIWAFIDLIYRYLPASGGKRLVPINIETYSDNGKPIGTLITLPRPPGYNFQAGQYALLRSGYFAEQESGCTKVLKQFEARESHPFSIASPDTDPDSISFIVGKAQGWTSRIFDAVDSQINQVTFTITRPQGAPAQDAKEYDACLLVGTGVGCTAMMSVFHSLITTPHVCPPEKTLTTGNSQRPSFLASETSLQTFSQHAIGTEATILTFTLQLISALMVILSLIVPNATYASDVSILAIDIVLNVIVSVILLCRIIWFAETLRNGGWDEAKFALRTLLAMDVFLLALSVTIIVLDAVGIAMMDNQHVVMQSWVAPVIISLTAVCLASIMARNWVYLYFHSPHSHAGQFPTMVRMVLSSSAHMDACETLLGSVLASNPAPNLDWGALFKVNGSSNQAYDVSTFSNVGVTRHSGKRFVDSDFLEMIRIMMNKMHDNQAERPYFLGVFYCGNQPAVKDALLRGIEQVQAEHQTFCHKCYVRLLCEVF